MTLAPSQEAVVHAFVCTCTWTHHAPASHKLPAQLSRRQDSTGRVFAQSPCEGGSSVLLRSIGAVIGVITKGERDPCVDLMRQRWVRMILKCASVLRHMWLGQAVQAVQAVGKRRHQGVEEPGHALALEHSIYRLGGARGNWTRQHSVNQQQSDGCQSAAK
jgi:hypothetical protein